jgi:hypothetical protein
MIENVSFVSTFLFEKQKLLSGSVQSKVLGSKERAYDRHEKGFLWEGRLAATVDAGNLSHRHSRFGAIAILNDLGCLTLLMTPCLEGHRRSG